MAIPNPERELARLRKVLTEKRPKVVVLLGASEFFRGEAFEAVLATVPESADLRRKDGQEDSDGRELGDLLGGGLFGSGTWLVIRRGDGWLKKHGSELQGLLSRVASGCGLLLELGKLDQRTKVARSLKQVGELFEFRDLYAEPYDRSHSPLGAEMVSWLVERSRRLEIALNPEAAFMLMSTAGQKPAELLAELQRLRDSLSAAGKEIVKPLGLEDLRGHLTCSFESTPFEFAEAVLDYDRKRASRSLHAMYARGVTSRDGSRVDTGGVFPFVTSWLQQTMHSVHRGRCLMDRGMALKDVARQLGVRVFVDRFASQVRSNTEFRLRKGLDLLMECQRDLRRTGEDAELLLERFLAGYFRKQRGAA